MVPTTLQFLIVMIAAASNERPQCKLDYTREEVSVLKEQLAALTGGKKICFTARQRRRLAEAGKLLTPIPALSGTDPDYANNWGISIGVPAGGSLGQAFSTITFTLLGGATPGLLATVKRKSDPETVTCCANLVSGRAIPFTNFTSDCSNATNPGIALTAADVPTIEKITVDVRSTTTPIVVDNLCLTKIEFGW